MAIATPRWNIDLANPGDAVYVGRADTVLVRVLRDQGFADRRILAVFALYGRALVGGGNDGFRKTALSIEGLTVTGKTLAVNCLTTVAKLLLPGGADAVVDVGEKEMKNRKFAQWTTTRCETARALVVREEPLFSTARLGRIWDGVTKTLVVVSNRGLAFQRAAAAAAAYEHRFLRIRFGTPIAVHDTSLESRIPLEGDELRGAFVEAYQILCAHPAVRIAVLDDVDA